MSDPLGLNRARLRQLLIETKHDPSISSRVETFSRHFLGSAYKPFPLIGSARTPEVFVASLDDFDCVTYVETVLSLASASSSDSFVTSLRKIRYEQGRIEWKRRNHYMSGWICNNLREGSVRRLPIRDVPRLRRARLLNVVPDLPARRTTVKPVPKNALARLAKYLCTADLIFFASTRHNLDFFHVGIIVRNSERLLMRHASRSQGGVVEQPLSDFLKANRMAGIVVVRPSSRALKRRHRTGIIQQG
jgi:hypothetical protein